MNPENQPQNPDIQRVIRKIEQERHDEKVTTLFMRILFTLTTTSVSTIVLWTELVGIDNHRLIILLCLLCFSSFYFVLEANAGLFSKLKLDKQWYLKNAIARRFLNKGEIAKLLQKALEEEDYIFARSLSNRLKKLNKP